MAKILNSVLIGIVAFFGFLAAFAFAGFRGDGGSAAGTTALERITAQWVPDPADRAGDGKAIEVRLTVQNTGPPAQAVAVEYETLVNGEVFDHGNVDVPQKVAAGKEATVRFTTRLGDGFAARWWPSHIAAQGETILVVRGALHVDGTDGARRLPFEWTSPWRGDVADLVLPLADCPRPGQPFCVDAVAADWDQGDRLRATFTLHSQGWQDLRVRDGTLTLSLGGVQVAQGAVDGAELPGGGSASLEATLRFDDDALAEWWQGHVERCEDSPAEVRLEIALEDAYGWDAGTAAWQTPPATFQTAFLCNGVPNLDGGGQGGIDGGDRTEAP